MKNSKLRRVLLLLACAVMLVSLSVGATLAYLQSTTKVVENTFSAGRVYITLDETKVNEFGEMLELLPGDESTPDGVWWPTDNKDAAGRTQDNKYKLYPGKLYVKDPTVHVQPNSETCYVFIKINKTDLTYTREIKDNEGNVTGTEIVDIEAAADAEYTRIVDQIKAHGWVEFDKENGIYLYQKLVNTLDDASERNLPIFDQFKIGEKAEVPDANNQATYDAQAAELKINIIAYAIQAEGFSAIRLNNDGTDNELTAVIADATKAWNAAQFDTSFDQ